MSLTLDRRLPRRGREIVAVIDPVWAAPGNDVTARVRPPAEARTPLAPVFDGAPAPGTRQRLEALGPAKFAAWMKEQKRVLVTDTTMRDAHQSLLATRMRTYDIAGAASAYAAGLPQLFSLECWGGATFDVAMRFLNEDPWERLARVRAAAPNILTQMLLRGSNGVGYTNYPDNVVKFFVRQAAAGGVDVFRIFDCLNWVENMRVSIDAVREAGKVAEGALCYTGDIEDPARDKYSLRYFVNLAKELEAAGLSRLQAVLTLVSGTAGAVAVSVWSDRAGAASPLRALLLGSAVTFVLAGILIAAGLVGAAAPAILALTSVLPGLLIVALMPALLAASRGRPGAATQFEVYMASMNLGSIAGTAVAGWLAPALPLQAFAALVAATFFAAFRMARRGDLLSPRP